MIEVLPHCVGDGVHCHAREFTDTEIYDDMMKEAKWPRKWNGGRKRKVVRVEVAK